MTIAEAFVERGKEQGIIEGKLEVALNLLKEVVDKLIVVKTTQLDPAQIEALQKEIDGE